ncbi:MAG: hypothetical protein AUI36_43815 [Cyanobacteria bacterium 13_1_40CM_2_61_4]|nr:MAG: hypothetical protein AUI36_43815 [Cyanobacteria bacterium 13_1_40CM_2_61_4]
MVRREIDESELNVRLSDQIQAHIASCPSCRAFRDERTRLRQLVGSLEPVTAPADFDLRLRARIAAERQRPVRASLFPHFLVSTPAMAAAAVIVMLAASIVWLSQRNGKQSPTVAQSGSALERPGNDSASTASKETNPNPASEASSAKTTEPRDQAATLNGSRDLNRKPNPPLVAKGRTPSREFAVEPAEVIKQIPDSPGEISLSAPNKPLVVSVEDNRGATRKFLLPPVSFGAQRLVDNRVPVSTSNSRSW